MSESKSKRFMALWKNNLGLKIMMSCLIIGLVVVMTLLLFLMKEIKAMNSEIGYIKGSVTSISGNFNAQSQSFLNELSDTLDSEASLIASYEVTAETYKTENNQLPLRISLIPKADYEDLAIEIKVIGLKTYTQMAALNKGIYVAKIPIDIIEQDLKFIVKFTHSEYINNEELDVYGDILQTFLMRTDAEANLTFTKRDSDLEISGEVISIYDPKYTHDRNYVASLQCYPVSGQVVIKVNGQEVINNAILLDTDLQNGEYSNCSVYTQTNEVIKNYKAGDQIEIVSVLVDNYGNEYTHVTHKYPE
ncbi:hypothetical protein [Fusibacter sp. 3D3]|uniref:hypothetical protein n=1 Tax=Fusibacter sp. 3D3 TaxID=1048380 RepID=UPI000853D6B8|nr:hypothetical protein [Fusibacter sp. 3D3]GAU77895.1 hypothetical protein F3D3_2524 [Fusibacter sp. 3D3]